MAGSLSGTSDSGNFSISSHSSISSCSSQNEHIFPYPHKPHKANQPAWQAMNKLLQQGQGQVSLTQFQLLRRVGGGNTGHVYVCKIKDPAIDLPHCLFAMKVVDTEALKAKKKKNRVHIEKEILQMLYHPFLPTLFADFEASHYSFLVMEYCPGGDLLTVLHHQPGLRFSISSAKFYAAEVLLALEYLHSMGIIYRDLKPENVLVQENGHIMLSDFDLSLKCDVVPKLLQGSYEPKGVKKSMKCIVSCVSIETSSKANMPVLDKKFWAEPIDACSSSFVGTHDYLAPEVILGLGHGNGVDWWAFGVFQYELLHGKTPFRGETNEQTLKNILDQPLVFHRASAISDVKQCEEMGKAHDLIRKLLVKNPKKRMGSFWGSVEIKKHEFFEGMNWALIRSVKPPYIPPGKINKLIKEINKVPRVEFF